MSSVTFMPRTQSEQFTKAQAQGLGVFEEFQTSDWSCMSACLGADFRSFRRRELISASSTNPEHLGIVLTGVALERVTQTTGNAPLVGVLEAGDVFGEAAIGMSPHAPATEIWGASDGEVLLLNVRQLNNRHAQCPAKGLLIENLMRTMVRKQQQTKELIEVANLRTLRERIMAYLRLVSRRQQRREIYVELGRGELAELLFADRSAFSRELHRMKAEGRIDFNGKTFTIIEPH